jgi:hypothetical protein
MRRTSTAALGAAIAALLFASAADAATVANPGSVTATFTGGSVKIGSGIIDAAVTPVAPSTWTGSVDENGNVSVPAANITFPPLPGSADINTVILGVQTMTLSGSIVPHDATGTIDPASGAAALTVPAHGTVTVTPPGGLGFGAVTCTLGSQAAPFPLALTTGTSGALTGTPYNQGDGTVSLVNGTFSIPAPSCTGDAVLVTALNTYFSTLNPLTSGNAIRLSGVLNPILTAPLPPGATPTGGGATTTTQQQTPQEQTGTTGTTGTNPLGPGATGRCVVPKLKGLKLAKAKSALTKANCKTGKIKKRKSRKRKGTVIASDPRTGVIVAPGAKVALTISKGMPKKKK